jgi:hypothetical protein
LVEFKDPSTDFILQFHPNGNENAGNDLELPLAEEKQSDPRVVSLEDFRKNRLSVVSG